MTSELGFSDLITIVHRRQRLILSIAIVGTALALVSGVMIPPQYTAKAQIVFDPQRFYANETTASVGQAAEEVTFQTHITALASRDFLAKALASISHGPSQESAPAAAGPARKAAVLDAFISHLRVYPEGISHVIAVTFTSRSAAQAARAANRIAQLYIEGDETRKRAVLMRFAGWIDERLPDAKAAFERTQIGREGTAAGQVYASLLQLREKVRIQQETITPDLHILSLASPPNRPSSSNPLLFIPPALVILLSIGGFLAIVLERLDECLHSVRDVAAELGVSCIGLAPLFQTEGKAPRPDEYFQENRFAPYTQAMRSIITTFGLNSVPGKARVILITSSLPGEGKSTLALSLTVCAALQGQRALLINFQPDIFARPRKTEDSIFDIYPLSESSSTATGYLKADHLQIRNDQEAPLRPLSGDLGHRLLSLRQTYDYVIIDGPSLVHDPEARLLAMMADNVVLAVKWNDTRRTVVQDALDLLRQVDGFAENLPQKVSAVLTQVNLQAYIRYRYSGWESIRSAGEAGLSATARYKWFNCLAWPTTVKLATSLINGPLTLFHTGTGWIRRQIWKVHAP